MKKLLYIFLFAVLSGGSVYGQCHDKPEAFQVGEKIYYSVYYNWGFIWLDAAEAYFEVLPGKYEGKSAFHFKSYGRSLDGYDWIFKVRDKYEAYASDSVLRSYYFVRDTYEGGYKVDNQYEFDYKNNLIYSQSENSKKLQIKDTLLLSPCTFDMLTAIYYARSIDYSNLKKDEKVPVHMIIDNEQVELYIRYKGRETIELKDGTKYKCIVFTALMMEGSIFNGGEDVKVWVTDDENKIPVLVEAKILVGSVKAYLSKTVGLKNPITSLIE